MRVEGVPPAGAEGGGEREPPRRGRRPRPGSAPAGEPPPAPEAAEPTAPAGEPGKGRHVDVRA